MHVFSKLTSIANSRQYPVEKLNDIEVDCSKEGQGVATDDGQMFKSTRETLAPAGFFLLLDPANSPPISL